MIGANSPTHPQSSSEEDGMKRGSCYLFAANLPKSWTNAEIHRELWSVFGGYGLEQCRATRDRKQLPIAFLRFSQPVALEQLAPVSIGERMVRLEYGRAEMEEETLQAVCFPIPVTVTVDFGHFKGTQTDLQLLLMRFGRVLEIAWVEKGEERNAYRVLYATPQEAFWCFDALNRYPVEGVAVRISFQ